MGRHFQRQITSSHSHGENLPRGRDVSEIGFRGFVHSLGNDFKQKTGGVVDIGPKDKCARGLIKVCPLLLSLWHSYHPWLEQVLWGHIWLQQRS